MGLGDHMMALGEAWAARQRDPSRLVALGDGRRLAPQQAGLDYGLDFLATQADLDAGRPVSWVRNYPGARGYIDYRAMQVDAANAQLRGIAATRYGRWLMPLLEPVIAPLLHWRARRYKVKRSLALSGRYRYRDYRPTPAPIVLKPNELELAEAVRRAGDFVIVEPSIKAEAARAKQWPVPRYHELALRLSQHIRVVQLSDPQAPRLDERIERLSTRSYREALACLGAARLYIGAEGGLHHGAAAMGTPAIVLFGGVTSPAATGYDGHVNLTGNAGYACGIAVDDCPHCAAAMDSIGVDEVLGHALRLLGLSQEVRV